MLSLVGLLQVALQCLQHLVRARQFVLGVGEQRNIYGTRSISVPLLPNTLFIAEAFAAMQTETGKWHPSGIFPKGDATQTPNPIGSAMDKEAVQMFSTGP